MVEGELTPQTDNPPEANEAAKLIIEWFVEQLDASGIQVNRIDAVCVSPELLMAAAERIKNEKRLN